MSECCGVILLCFFFLQMSSSQMEKDLKMLLDMEIRIRLLDAEGIAIPNEPPPIPPEPENYDFNYPEL